MREKRLGRNWRGEVHKRHTLLNGSACFKMVEKFPYLQTTRDWKKVTCRRCLAAKTSATRRALWRSIKDCRHVLNDRAETASKN